LTVVAFAADSVSGEFTGFSSGVADPDFLT
jgi:hypothetical protein